MRKILTAYYNREPEKSKCLLCPMETKTRRVRNMPPLPEKTPFALRFFLHSREGYSILKL